MSKGPMVKPTWLGRVPAADRRQYSYQLDRLSQHVDDEIREPNKPFKQHRLGLELSCDSEANVRAFALATMLASNAANMAGIEPDVRILRDTLTILLRRRIPFTGDDQNVLLTYIESLKSVKEQVPLLPGVLAVWERATRTDSLLPEVCERLQAISSNLASLGGKQAKAAERLRQQIDKLCNDSVSARLSPDDGWADDLRARIADLNGDLRFRWEALLRMAAAVCPEPPASDWRVTIEETEVDFGDPQMFSVLSQMQLKRLPAEKWRLAINQAVAEIGPAVVAAQIENTLLQVRRSKPGMLVRDSLNREVMRGLLWLTRESASPELMTGLQHAARWFYENNSPLGQAAVCVLANFPGRMAAPALVAIAARVTAQGQREFLAQALAMVAERLGIDVEELADEPLPTFGFTELGQRTFTFGVVTARLRVGDRREVSLDWTKGGKVVKSVPALVKRDHGEELAELKTLAAGVRECISALPAQLEASYLRQSTWPAAQWRQRLIDHPLAGIIGQKLLWRTMGPTPQTGRFENGVLRGIDGTPIELAESMPLSLWHPVAASASEVLEWREHLEKALITQPFKQAHRELYLLTDAERASATYSNRFAGHIIRQAQFRQLAKSRGWKTSLIGPWDSGGEPAHRDLARWNIRAEFWMQGSGDDFQTGYTYVATDQVRFYPLGEREPIPLERIQPLVFSEVMRDVDLFVGVASVGNDPTWQDGGPVGRYRIYWQSYSFGELSETATTRKQVLERLVPRLKIANRCSISDRFLIVRGHKRTYKIHFGSGNILMEPNDQYLCIVPDARFRTQPDDLFLPFEGDATLSIILSKALLLAGDDTIKDPTITRQIEGK